LIGYRTLRLAGAGERLGLLWGERVVRSAANLTSRDAEEFLSLAAQADVRTTTQNYPLADANRALTDLRRGLCRGAAVLIP